MTEPRVSKMKLESGCWSLANQKSEAEVVVVVLCCIPSGPGNAM